MQKIKEAVADVTRTAPMRILALTLALLLLPTLAEAPMKQYIPPPKPTAQQRAKQEPRKVMFEVTAYSAHDSGMNGKGITASGVRAGRWHTVAASRGIPFGTRIHFPALGKTFVVLDRGGQIRGNRIDLFVGSRTEAVKFGRRKLEGVILDD